MKTIVSNLKCASLIAKNGKIMRQRRKKFRRIDSGRTEIHFTESLSSPKWDYDSM